MEAALLEEAAAAEAFRAEVSQVVGRGLKVSRVASISVDNQRPASMETRAKGGTEMMTTATTTVMMVWVDTTTSELLSTLLAVRTWRKQLLDSDGAWWPWRLHSSSYPSSSRRRSSCCISVSCLRHLRALHWASCKYWNPGK